MKKRYVVSVLLVLAAGACKDTLIVDNTNSPDRTRVFSNAADLTVFTAGLFAVMHQGTLGGNNDDLSTQMYVMSLENMSGLANFAMGPRGAIPRSQITNARASQGDAGNTHDWFREHRAAREAALAYAAIGNPSLGTPALDARGKAFARLVQGIALGNLSLAYDSASIITEKDNPEADAGVIVPLSGYQAVNAAALGYLDSAIAIATANAGSFPIPVTANLWINGISVTQALFIQIARSYKAYIRANVARTPAERALVDWTQVVADASAGITADLSPQMDPTNGWDIAWASQQYATGSANWHQVHQFMIGMADSTGGYDAWLATPRANRVQFAVVTADRRFPGAQCPVSSITRNTTTNLATVTTPNAHGIVTGASIILSGSNQPEYNGTFSVTAATTTTVTFTVAGTPATPSTGTSVYLVPAATRATLIGCGPGTGGQAFNNMPYFRNRPSGEDQPGEPLGTSQYDFYRSRQFQQASRIGPHPIMTASVIRLLAAEGNIRNGNYAAAIPLINVSRNAAGLPSLVTPDTTTAVPGGTLGLPLPGGASCVPRVPDAAAGAGPYKGTKCGTMWDALKWEYRMESYFIVYGGWFFAGRGWGDLPEGTAMHWPVPNTEMDSRAQAFYGLGGVGATGGSGKGNYGLFAGGVY